jgi:hypothetical protein
MIHFDPQMFVVRFYEDGKCHENHDEFSATLTLHKIEDIAYVVAMHGDISRKAYMQFVDQCRDMGIKKLRGYRKQDDQVTEWDL